MSEGRRLSDGSEYASLTGEITALRVDVEKIRAMLDERCESREKTMLTLYKTSTALDLRVSRIEQEHHLIERLSEESVRQGKRMLDLEKSMAKWGVIITVVQAMITAGALKIFLP